MVLRGEPRVLAIEHSGIPLYPASLVALEKNAMVYAGFCVWNTRSFTKPNREDSARRTLYNPDKEVVTSAKPTHPALITMAEARTSRLARLLSSPIARALIGRSEGDMAEVLAPSGKRTYSIVSVAYG